VAVVLAILLVVLINALGSRFSIRHDFSRARYYSLSDKTISLLREVRQPIAITAVVETDFELFQDVRSLLREYEAASPRLKIRFVDPDRDLGEARNLARRYGLAEANSLILELGGRYAVVEARKMMDYNYWPLVEGRPKARVAFRGEQMLSTAIQGLLQPRLPRVAFTTGQGEGDVEQFTMSGYSRIGMAVRRDAIRSVKLTPGETVPDDCAAVVVLGPTRPFAPSALAALRAYLERGGRVLFLLEKGKGTGLETFLEAWGVRVGDDRVGGPALTGRELLVSDFADHPITHGLRNMACAFYSPHPVEALSGGSLSDRLRVTSLAFGPANGWIETDPAEDPPHFDAGADKAGPVSIAVAVERGIPAGLKVPLPATRLVVIGDADFAANGTLAGGNEDFFMSALNWLLERDHLAAVSPRIPDEIRMDMDKRQRGRLFLLVVAGFPGAALFLACLVALARRR
jgi:ABC-type uncharacterized transport system involved in gliding motility auxiliary subunit